MIGWPGGPQTRGSKPQIPAPYQPPPNIRPTPMNPAQPIPKLLVDPRVRAKQSRTTTFQRNPVGTQDSPVLKAGVKPGAAPVQQPVQPKTARKQAWWEIAWGHAKRAKASSKIKREQIATDLGQKVKAVQGDDFTDVVNTTRVRTLQGPTLRAAIPQREQPPLTAKQVDAGWNGFPSVRLFGTFNRFAATNERSHVAPGFATLLGPPTPVTNVFKTYA